MKSFLLGSSSATLIMASLAISWIISPHYVIGSALVTSISAITYGLKD